MAACPGETKTWLLWAAAEAAPWRMHVPRCALPVGTRLLCLPSTPCAGVLVGMGVMAASLLLFTL